MIICIHSRVIGTKKHLVCDVSVGKEWSWTSFIPRDSWVFGDRLINNSLDVILDFLNLDHPVMGSRSHAKAFNVLLGHGDHNIPWHNVLPANKFRSALNNLISVLEDALRTFLDMGYGETFMKSRVLLTGLSRAYIDGKLLLKYINEEKNATVRTTLKSFRPDKENQARRINYSQSNTVTGRLTVLSGPQVLTLPKKYRDVIASRYKGGVIAQVDFTSLEPRVARLASGGNAEADVYVQLSNELFNASLAREQVKIAVLCALYGVSKNKLSSMLGPGFNADQVIKSIRTFFGIPCLAKDLRSQIRACSVIQNHFGRIIEPSKVDENILINHYVQSTAVDVAALGFCRLVESIAPLDVKPLFIIHDALILDISPESLQDVKEILGSGLGVPSMGNFPVEFSIIRDASNN